MTQRIFLVTGSSRGIGLGLVRELISRGHKVVATCRNPESASELANVLAENGQPEAVACDVTSDASVEECFNKVSLLVPHLDVLINNAGMSNKDHPEEPPSKIDRAEFSEIMNTNVAGVMAMTRAFIPLLRKSPADGQAEAGANVINISSSLGSIQLTSGSFTCTSYRGLPLFVVQLLPRPRKTWAVFALCSKAALNMLTKCFSQENTDLTFVAMHPGWVQTDMGSAKNRQPPLTVPESANGILDVANKIAKSDSGSFWGFDGQKLPY